MRCLVTDRSAFFAYLEYDLKDGFCNFVESMSQVYCNMYRPRRKMYFYQKGDCESMRKDTSDFAKDIGTSMITRLFARFRITLTY